MIHFTRFFAALCLSGVASSAIACADLHGAHECGAGNEIAPLGFQNCVLVKAPGVATENLVFFLPPGNRVWICPGDADERANEMDEQ